MQTSITPMVVVENAGTAQSSCLPAPKVLRAPKLVCDRRDIFSRDQGDPAMEEPKLPKSVCTLRPAKVRVFRRTTGLFVASNAFLINTSASAVVPIARMSDVFRRHMLFLQERPTEIVDIGSFPLKSDMCPHEIIDMVNRPHSSMMLAHIHACMSRELVNTRNGFGDHGTKYVCPISILGTPWFVTAFFSRKEKGWVLDAHMVDDPITIKRGTHFCCIC